VLDDPSDGIGAAPGTPCKPLPGGGSGGGGTVPVSGGSGSVLNLNVLGISLSGAGSLVDIVCSLFGDRPVLGPLLGSGSLLGSFVSAGADVAVCDSGTQLAVDRQPADATAVTSTVTWTRPRAGRVVQRAVVSGPRRTTP
jgi:hypothetical protein